MTLTEAAYWTRRFGLLGAGVLAVLIIIIVIVLNLTAKNALSQYQKPNFACTNTKEEFTKYKLTIPSLSLAAGSDLVYEVETPTGKVESLPRIVDIHKYTILGQALNSQGEAKLLANKLGFKPDLMQRRGTSEYVWYDAKTFRTLVVQARNLNFTLTTDFTKDNAINRGGKLPSDSEAVSLATDYLRSKSLLTEDMTKVEPYIVPVRIQANGSFVQASSRDTAQLLRVSFFRKVSMISVRSDISDAQTLKKDLERKGFKTTLDTLNTKKGVIDVYKFEAEGVYEDMYNPNVSVYVGTTNTLDKEANSSNRNVYAVNYRFWSVPDFSCGTYQLIPASTALDMVQKGQGSLIYLNDKNGDEIVKYTPRKVRKFTIYDINIKYYESQTEQPFLQPIYVISGEATFDNGIIGVFHYYVPAVDYNSVQNKQVDNTVEDTNLDTNSIFN